MNILYEQKKIDQSNLAEESFNVSSIIEEVRQISQDIGKKDVGELHKRFFTGINFIQVFEEIQKCRKILFAIFPFLSRALIQKTNF